MKIYCVVVLTAIYLHPVVHLPETVAAALEQLYRDPALLAEMSHRARARATDPALSWDRIAAQWVNLFDEVMATHPDAGRG